MDPQFEQELISNLPALRRFALSLCRNADVADDLVQITVERAVKSRDTFEPGTNMISWLFRILRNAWIDMTRRNRTRGTEIDLSYSPDAAAVDGRRVTESRLMLGAVEQALADLPADQREVLLLVCFEEMSYAETSEVLGIPIGTVMSRLSRARIALVKILGIE